MSHPIYLKDGPKSPEEDSLDRGDIVHVRVNPVQSELQVYP